MLAPLLAFDRRLKWYLKQRPGVTALVSSGRSQALGERRPLSLLKQSRMKKLLRRRPDETQFLS